LLAVTALGAAACGPADSTAGGKSAPSPASFPEDDLAKAILALNSTSEKFSVSQNGSVYSTGSVDVPDKAADVSFKFHEDKITVKYEILVVDPDIFVKYDFGSTINKHYKLDPKKWYRIDATKVTNKDSINLLGDDGKDPMLLQAIVQAMSSVKTTDKATYTGTIDLDAAANSVLVPADGLKDKYGDKIKAVPFTATVADGKLTSFKIDGTGIGDDVTSEATFSAFGQAAVTKPATSTAASSSIYDLLNGS
jgi:hypothetical protein